jgi:hypothetical protein
MTEVFSYQHPRIDSPVTGNREAWLAVQPTNGSVFRSGMNQYITLNISSNSSFLRTVQSFLAATVVPLDAQNNPIQGAKMTSLGAAACFSRMEIRFADGIVETIEDYNDILALAYSTASVNRKKVLQKLEGYGNVDFAAGGATRFAHALYSSLMVTPQLLPLPVLQTGVTISLHMAPVEYVFTSPVDHYELRNVSFKYCSVTPDPAFTIALLNAVQSQNRALYIPMQQITSYKTVGNGSMNQIVNIASGQKSSIVSVDSVVWRASDYADRTKDKAKRFINAGLVSWKINAAGLQSPQNALSFEYEGGSNPESLLMTLMSESGSVYDLGSQFSIPDDFETSSFRIGLNYQSSTENFSQGISTIGAASPFITLEMQNDRPLTSDYVINSIVTNDALVAISGAGIQVSSVF